MTPIPFPNATRELRRAWTNDVDVVLGQAEVLLHTPEIPLAQRVALQVDIGQVRTALAVERALLDGQAR